MGKPKKKTKAPTFSFKRLLKSGPEVLIPTLLTLMGFIYLAGRSFNWW